MNHSELLEEMAQAVIDGDAEQAVALAEQALREGLPPLRAINEGFVKGIREVGDCFGRGEFFLPELVMGAEAMKAALEILEPELARRQEARQRLGLAVSGTVQGDIHDIGKTLVGVMLSANGFEVIDLGVNVPAATFVEQVRQRRPDLLLLSALITTTMLRQGEVIRALREAGLRDQVKVMVGGAPTTPAWARDIGADGYAENAGEAVVVARQLLGIIE
ncbi:MAG: corrinoid protein [Chloroflexi bacterium]|nr:corrinoid protein [Chloroflexota bacterium]